MGTKFSTTPLAGYTNTKFPALSDETAKGHVTPAGMRAAINVEDGADVTDATNVQAAGAAMTTNDLSDLNDAATARANLGLGSAATTNTTAYATAAQGTKADDALPASSVLDEDDFATDSASLPPSQQSTAAYTAATALAYAQAVSRATTQSSLVDNTSAANAGTGGNVSYVPGRKFFEARSGTTADNSAHRLCGVPFGTDIRSGTDEPDYSFDSDLTTSFTFQPALVDTDTLIMSGVMSGLFSNATKRYADLDTTANINNLLVRMEIRNLDVYLVALGYDAGGNVKSEAGGTLTLTAGVEYTALIEFTSGTSVKLYIWDGTTRTLAAELTHNGTTVIIPSSGGNQPRFYVLTKATAAGIEARCRFSSDVHFYDPSRFFLVP